MAKSTEYQEGIKQQKLSRCPYLRKIFNGDEVYYYCSQMECACWIEYGQGVCDEWDEINKQWVVEGDKVKLEVK